MNYYSFALLTFLFCINVNAEARNCTIDEKKNGNDALLHLQNNEIEKNRLINYHMPLGIHTSKKIAANEELFYQGGFIAFHDRDLRTTLWTSYRLTKADRDGADGKDRVNCFRTDPRLDNKHTGMSSDYDEAIYDRGHMTPDSDVKDDLIEQINSYTYVNMSPQYCFFNRGIWLNLEHLTKRFAEKYDDILVTNGAIFDVDGLGGRDKDSNVDRMLSRNGKSRVAVPTHYYRVIIKQEGHYWRSIAFMLPNNNVSHGDTWADAKPYALDKITSLELIEAKASVNLFPDFPRAGIIQSLDGTNWDFSVAGKGLTSRCN